jgi:hypothetical protein
MTSSSKLWRFRLLLTLILSAVAVMALGCRGSRTPGTTKSASDASKPRSAHSARRGPTIEEVNPCRNIFGKRLIPRLE